MDVLLKLRRLLAEPLLAGVDMDGDERIEVHTRILRERPMVQEVFGDFCHVCRELDEKYLNGSGQRIELGSGTGLFRRFYPDTLLSDVVPAPQLDMVLDAQDMELPDESVRAFYAINTFHHFHQPDRFFRELDRVLVPGGGCVLVEPYYGPTAEMFFARMFDSEGYDKQQHSPGKDGSHKSTGADLRNNKGAMTGANQALSYIIFHRDAARFSKDHPNLSVVCERRMQNSIRYFFSGGLNFRPLAPNWSTPFLRTAERVLSPIDRLWSLHYAIVIQKRAQATTARAPEAV